MTGNMKKVVLSAIFFMMAMLAACTKYQINEEPSDNNNPFPDYVYNQEKEQGVYGQSDMAIAENGYYYIIDNILYFYNINSDVNMPLCSKVNCNHDGETCDAYVSGINTENGTFGCNCMDEKVMYYNNHLYCIEVTKDRDYYLCQYDATFGNKERITKLASVKDEQITVTSVQASMISDGYFYYYTSFLDADYAKNGYIAPFYICRIRLESNSSREVLGEFQFPGDYAMKAGQNNGFGVYLSDNNIYFYAGGTARMYFSDNNVQYRVSKYDLSTGQYTELWTYTGDDRVDVFGENTGKVDSMSDGSYVRMDSNGNFYIMTSSTGNDNDTLIKVNFDKNTSEVIYTTDMEKLYSLQSDGEYLYFFESTQSRETKSYFTAIDMNGTLKAQYEMEYDEEFLEKAKKYYEQYPEDTSVVADASGICVYGIDERYILMGSNSDSDVYKNLKSLNSKPYKKVITTGVGVINKMDYLNSGTASIKQIYQNLS